MKCKSCGTKLDLTMGNCPVCGLEVPLGRLTGLLGIVCRHCDAYNEPDAKQCVACGKPLGSSPQPKAPAPAPPPGQPTTPLAEAAPPAARASDPIPIPLTAAVADGGSPKPLVDAMSKLAAAGKAAAAEAARPADAPIPLVALCPNCGQPAGSDPVCPACGQAIGAHGTRLVTEVPFTDESPAGPEVQLDQASLVLEHGEGLQGAVFRISAEEVQAGRAVGTVLFPDDPCLAPLHATFVCRQGKLRVRDEGGASGVYVRLRAPAPLKPGDLFSAGNRLLRFAGPLPPAPPPPPDGTIRIGSPRPPGLSLLVEEWLEGGAGGRVYLRPGPSVTIGRTGCSINLGEDPFLSQAHAEIFVDQDGTTKLRDLGSSNGTYTRVPPLGEREIRNGDMIRMGREVLRIAVS